MKWLLLLVLSFSAVGGELIAYHNNEDGTITQITDIVPSADSVLILGYCREGYLARTVLNVHEDLFGCWQQHDKWITIMFTDGSSIDYPIESFIKYERPVDRKQAPPKSGAK